MCTQSMYGIRTMILKVHTYEFQLKLKLRTFKRAKCGTKEKLNPNWCRDLLLCTQFQSCITACSSKIMTPMTKPETLSHAEEYTRFTFCVPDACYGNLAFNLTFSEETTKLHGKMLLSITHVILHGIHIVRNNENQWKTTEHKEVRIFCDFVTISNELIKRFHYERMIQLSSSLWKNMYKWQECEVENAFRKLLFNFQKLFL